MLIQHILDRSFCFVLCLKTKHTYGQGCFVLDFVILGGLSGEEGVCKKNHLLWGAEIKRLVFFLDFGYKGLVWKEKLMGWKGSWLQMMPTMLKFYFAVCLG